MANIYEMYYENKNGDIIHCQDFYDEQEVLREVYYLSYEFPEHSYWYEVTYEDEQ